MSYPPQNPQYPPGPGAAPPYTAPGYAQPGYPPQPGYPVQQPPQGQYPPPTGYPAQQPYPGQYPPQPGYPQQQPGYPAQVVQPVIVQQPVPVEHGHRRKSRDDSNACCWGLCAGLACCCLLDGCDGCIDIECCDFD